MGREIKFRYIVKHIESGNIETKVYSLSQIEQRPLKELSPVFLSDYELLGKSQFTGLKDFAGNDIFEDDVLEWDSEIWGDDFIEEARWDYELLDSRQFEWSKHCVVIGNIYANPELLEESK